MMVLRLRRWRPAGRSATDVAAAYAGLLSAGLTPVVREYGSLGCSGDLAPLAHCALALMGEGTIVTASGERMAASDALAACRLEPVQLAEKEGLALINGTDGMLGMLILTIADLRELIVAADVIAAMSVEALLGTDAVFAADLHELRPQAGQARAATVIRSVLEGSDIVASHRGPEDTRVQDAYSLRCAPIVSGAARDTVDHAAAVAERELRSAIDNPVVTPDGRVESNGNFHGAPIAYVLDFLAIVAADRQACPNAHRSISRRRPKPRPAALPGGRSGRRLRYMIAQYTQAAIVSDMKRLAVPASVDSIPTSAMQEDHVSMGWGAGSSCAAPSRASARCWRSSCWRPRGARPARAADAGAGDRRGPRCAWELVPGPGSDRFLAPEMTRPSSSSGMGRFARRAAASRMQRRR